MKFVLFDMDGTIIDHKLGFVGCINYALTKMGKAPVLESELEKYIGPPIDLVFKELVPSSSTIFITERINKFRERYLDIEWHGKVSF